MAAMIAELKVRRLETPISIADYDISNEPQKIFHLQEMYLIV